MLLLDGAFASNDMRVHSAQRPDSIVARMFAAIDWMPPRVSHTDLVYSDQTRT